MSHLVEFFVTPARLRAASLVTAAVIVIGVAAPAVVFAKPSCTKWADQGNGTYWRECVNDDGSMHCYVISKEAGSVQHEVSCIPKKKKKEKSK